MTTTTTGKTVYFVVAVDLETKTKYIDDEMFTTSGFQNGHAYNIDSQEWEYETEEEYAEALAILNNPEWEKE